MWRSVRQTAHACTRTRSWPGAGSCRGSSVATKDVPARVSTIAFTTRHPRTLRCTFTTSTRLARKQPLTCRTRRDNTAWGSCLDSTRQESHLRFLEEVQRGGEIAVEVADRRPARPHGLHLSRRCCAARRRR